MEIRMEGKNGPALTGIDPVLAQIRQRLQARPQEWLEALRRNPGGLADVEQEVHRAFAEMADQVVAGLLAQSTAGTTFTEAAKKK